jgi:hypothetical protein
MTPPESKPDWKELEAEADRPEIQQQIREAIRRGVIRVLPAGPGKIRIVPDDDFKTTQASSRGAVVSERS